ncbi:MAG: hypothetical protein U1E24_15830, partial [Phenylobacterium sp.]|nr:hypothetical protein [Phenylobacterium sp.]
YGPVSRQNLKSPGVRVEVRPSSRFEAMAMYRGLWLEAGAARLFKGRVLTDAPNAPNSGDTVYGYADVTVSF